MFEFHNLNCVIESNYSLMLQDAARPQYYTGITPPIALTTIFHRQETVENIDDYCVYSRSRNPGFILLERQLTRLHDGRSATVFASGMAAISAAICSLSRQGTTVLCGDEMYYEVEECLATLGEFAGLKTVKVDVCDTDATLATAANIHDLGLVYLESANNPSSRMADLPTLSAGLKRLHPEVPIVVDNTWLSPILYKPLQHGADFVIESATKYISGRGDVLLGAVICSKHNRKRINPLMHRLRRWRQLHGAVPSPFNCWLVSKALETLPLRMEQTCRSARIIANALASVPCITRVLHPSLPNHPTYERAKTLLGEPRSGVIFLHLPIEKAIAKKLVWKLEPVINATSYGEAHTLVNSTEPGNSALYPGERDSGVPVKDGYWFRIAVGLQPPAEIIRGLLIGFAQYLTEPLGIVQRYYPKFKIVEISLDQDQLGHSLDSGDLLVVGLDADKDVQISFYEVLEPSRCVGESPASCITVRVPSGLKSGIRLSKFRRFD